MLRRELDRNLIRKRWLKIFHRLNPYWYSDGHWPQEILQPGRLRKSKPNTNYHGTPPGDLRRIWSKKTRARFRTEIYHCRDLAEFYFDWNHRHWGLYEWY